ncbi:hypothetical protein GQ44DRAFT_725897 [Phaeosphaeriaceae sp. PMI808]|nr:hypothetical protein GQ44DRAFT_725897 [Phaeosphaeriaceae sp. PMI808]
MTARHWIKYGILGILILTIISSAILVLKALTSQNDTKAGITTFRPQFNVTDIASAIHLPKVKTKRASEPNIIHSLQGGIQSAAAGIASEVPVAITQIQSAASTLTTTIPDSIEALIPQNLSLGTKQFCVGLPHNVSCHGLPLSISSLIPTDIQKYLQTEWNDIESLSSALKEITPTAIYRSLLLGLALMLVMAATTICLVFLPTIYLPSILGLKIVKFGVLLLLGTICCGLFIAPVIILGILNSKAKQLPSWIQVEHGEVGKFTVWSLVLVGVAAITSVLSLSCYKCSRRESRRVTQCILEFNR